MHKYSWHLFVNSSHYVPHPSQSDGVLFYFLAVGGAAFLQTCSQQNCLGKSKKVSENQDILQKISKNVLTLTLGIAIIKKKTAVLCKKGEV